MLEFYDQKYADGSKILVLKSLTYFDDTEKDLIPNMFVTTNWKEVKSEIIKQVRIFSDNI